MRRYGWLWLLLLLAIVGCGQGATDAPAERVETRADRLTTISVPGTISLSNFGRRFGRGVAFGQVVTIPATDSLLLSFSFVMSLPTTVIFRGHIYAWDGAKATGASLWNGPPRSTSGASNETVVFNPNVRLMPGAQYVLFASTTEDAFPDAVGSWGFSNSNPYPGGGAFVLNDGPGVGWTTTAWSIYQGCDFAFGATFDQPPPTTTTTALASSANPSVLGQSTTFTATVTSMWGTPTGSVTFRDGATVLGAVALNGAGQASVATSTLAIASHSITAEYLGAPTFLASTSGALSQVVNKVGTLTALVSSVNPSTINQSVTVTATVTAQSPGTGTPAGSISFREGATVLGSATLDGSGVATFTTSTLSIGTHGITADYAGDASYKTSTSPSVSQVVNQDGATVALTASPSPSTYATNVTFKATVSSVGLGGAPTGTVTFRDGTTTLGTGTLDGSGVATFSTATLVGGSRTIAADYAGDAKHAAATGTTSHIVSVASSTTTNVSLTNPSAFGQSVTFTATVAGAGVTPTGTVTFTDGPTVLATQTLGGAGQASFTIASLDVGTHAIVATYNGNSNYAASATSVAGAVSQVVNKANTTTALASSSNPSVVGKDVTFTATVAAVAPGAGVPAGTVSFRSGGDELGIGTINGAGVATFTTGSLAVGTASITAVYSGNSSFAGNISSALAQVVNQDGVSASVTAAPNPSKFGDNVTFTATIASSGSGGTPTGTVTFKDGGTTLGASALDASGVATFSTASLSGGPHTIDVAYAGDMNHGAGAASVSLTVDPAITTTTLAASPNPSVFGQSVTFTATVASAAPGTPTGIVTFTDGTIALGTGTLNAQGSATLSIATLAVASHPITVVYAGDTSFATSTSAALAQVVNRSDTSTSVSSSSDPSLSGRSVTLTATVVPTASGAGIPSGTVTFMEGATTLGTGTLDATGVATFATTFTTGAHSVTVEYGGDGSFNASTSAAFEQNVNADAATIVVTSSPTPSTFGQEITIKAVLAGPGSAPTGTVTFKDGSTTIATGTVGANGETTVKTATLAVGAHALVGEYSGDATYATGQGSASHTVDKAATTTTLATSASTSTLGESVTFTATVASAVAGFSGEVEFFDGSTSLGKATLQGGKATVATSSLTAGGHAMTAKYLGTMSFSASTSTALTQTVETKDTSGAPGAPGAPVDGTNDAGTPGDVAAPVSDGCGCRTAPAPTATFALAPLASLALLGMRRRRRS